MIIRQEFIKLASLIDQGDFISAMETVKSFSEDMNIEFIEYFYYKNQNNTYQYIHYKIICEMIDTILDKVSEENIRQKLWELSFKYFYTIANKAYEEKFFIDVYKFGTKALQYPQISKEDKSDILYLLILSMYQMQDYSRELEFAKLLVELDRNYLSLYNYASALMRNQQYEKARTYFEESIELEKFPPALSHLGVVLFIEYNDYANSYGYFEKALETYFKNERKFPNVNPTAYILNIIVVSSFSGDVNLLSKLDEHKDSFKQGISKNSKLKNNIFMIHFIEVGKIINKGIFYLKELDTSKATGLLNEAEVKMKDLISECPIKSKIFLDTLENIQYFLQITKIINSIKYITDDINLNQDYNSAVNKLKELIQNLSKISSGKHFSEYKLILNTFLNLVKSLIDVLVFNYKIDENEIKTTKFILDTNINKASFIITEYKKKSYNILQIFHEYICESSGTFFIDSLKEKCLGKLYNIISDPVNLLNDVKLVVFNSGLKYMDSNVLLCSNIVEVINNLQRVEFSFIKDYKNNQKSLLEEDFRNVFALSLNGLYDISAEELSKGGRTDLILKGKFTGIKKIEFKIWGRNDYKKVVKQITDYLTDSDSEGYIVMINTSKKNIIIDYFNYAQTNDMNYIENSFLEKELSGFKYYITKHKTPTSEKKIFHFIYNIY